MMKPARLALIAFVFHGFGVRWLAHERLGRRLFRQNVVAVLGTLAGVAAAFAFASAEQRSSGAWAAFLVGHFGWGTYLAARVYQRARIGTAMPRRATRSDVPALVALVNAAYQGEPGAASWTSEASIIFGPRILAPAIEERIASADGVILVLEDSTGSPPSPIVGCVHVERRGDAGYIGLLSVRPRAQSARVGTRLLQAAEAYVQKSLALAFSIVWVVNAREELAAWYERAGYVRTGETHPFPPAEARVSGLVFVVFRKRFG